MPPASGEAVKRRAGIQPADRREQAPGLTRLVADDPVLRAPPELERHARERDRACVRDRTADLVRAARGRRRSADLLARERLEVDPERSVPDARARSTARQPRKVPVLEREVCDRVE